MLMAFYSEKKIKEKKVSLNKDARSIQENVYHLTSRSDFFNPTSIYM